jgi:hypothetical protein
MIRRGRYAKAEGPNTVDLERRRNPGQSSNEQRQ